MPLKKKRKKKNFVKEIRKNFIIYSILLVTAAIMGVIISFLSSDFSREKNTEDIVAKEELRQKEADNFAQSVKELVRIKIKEINSSSKR